MSKSKILLIIGVWVAILPYLGFPSILKNILFTLTGLLIAYISYNFYSENKINKKESRTFENFSEHDNSMKEDSEIENTKVRI